MNNNLHIYTEQFKVHANEVDMNARTKITIILDYLQNTAWAHYHNFENQKGKILPDNLIWVISKLRLDIIRMSHWKEIIKVKTWAPFVDKYFAYRNFEIFDEKNNVMGKATFSWVILNKVIKKIVMPKKFKDEWQFYKTPFFLN